MTGLHPRFPYGMHEDLQLIIADEVDVTLVYPSKFGAIAVATTAYAEHLDFAGLLPDDIREGFKAARAKAVKFAPTPTEVRDQVTAAYVARRRREAPPSATAEEEPFLVEIPDELRQAWRDALGGAPPEPHRTEFEDGVPVPPRATPIGVVVQRFRAGIE